MKRTWFNLAAVLLICFQLAQQVGGAPQQAPARSPRIAELARKVRSGDKRAVQMFWSKVRQEGAPLIEAISGDKDHQLVTFLWRAEVPVRNVLLISGLSNESYTRTEFSENVLSQLPGTDVWYRTFRVRSDARFTYRFSVNDSLVPSEEVKNPSTREAKFQSDPLNSKHVSGPGSASLVELPNAPPQPWFQPRHGTPSGRLTRIPFSSQVLGNQRTLTI